MKQEMNNWRGFISLEEQKINEGFVNFYKNPPMAEHITYVLGIQVPLNESYTSYSQTLVEEIVREQLLFEGFWDDIKEKTNQYGKSVVNLFTVFKRIIGRPLSVKMFSGILSNYLRTIRINFIAKVMEHRSKLMGKLPAVDKMLQIMYDGIINLDDAIHKLKGSKGSWKYILAACGLIAMFDFVQKKWKRFFVGELTEDALENVTKTLSTYLSKTVNIDTIVSKIGATLTDVSSYLGLIGKLAGGVAMFADSLSPLTGQFIKKYMPNKD